MGRLIVLLPAAFALAACGGSSSSSSSSTTGAAGGGVVKTISISEKEYSLTPSSLTLAKTGTYEFRATNDGAIPHALEVEGNGVEAKTGSISPGASSTLRVTLSKAGSYEVYCPIDGHKSLGMKGTLTVGGGSGSGSGSGGGTTTTTSTAPGY